MSVDNKISALVNEQLPSFVAEQGPNFVAFIKGYYEYLEQSGNALHANKSLLDNQDIDLAESGYLEFFEKEILESVPANIKVDRRLLAKHIKDLYRSRGSESSYRLLFRILFDEEIDLYVPGDDILKASDGRWVQENSIRVSAALTGNIDSLLGEKVFGSSSGAGGKVEKIVGSLESGVSVSELYLNNLEGIFQDNEVITNSANTVSATIVNTTGPLKSINITNGGAFHQTGDEVAISSLSGSGGVGTVTGTNDDSAVEFYIEDGGTGYTLNSVISITDSNGQNADFTIDAITNTQLIPVNTDIIQDVANVPLNSLPNFSASGANTATLNAAFAAAKLTDTITSALTYQDRTTGTISALSTTNYGFGYFNLPSVSVTETDIAGRLLDDGNDGIVGNNADIRARHVSGTITSVNVTIPGINFNRFESLDIVNNTRSGTEDGHGNPFVSGVVQYPGRYIDTKGWLSWNNKLQDNFYYQEYSYEIISQQFVNTYKNVVEKVLHPGGTKMFGRIRISSDVSSLPSTVVTSQTKYIINTEPYKFLQLGNIHFNSANTVQDYDTTIINQFGAVAIDDVGSTKLMFGENTDFTTSLIVGRPFMIVDNAGVTSNTVITANTIHSDTLVTLSDNYPSYIANGVIYIANTSLSL